MNLTLRMTLTFTSTLVLVLALSLSFVFLESSGEVTKNITEKTLVLVHAFESQLYTGTGKEGADGRNDVFTKAVQRIQKAMPNVEEINVYHVGLGKVVASTDNEVIGKEVDPEDIEAAHTDQGVILFETEDGHDVIDVTEPLHDEGKIDYVIGIKTNIDEDKAAVTQLVLFSFGLGIGGALLGALLIVFTARRIVRPISEIGRHLRAMAERDLTGRASVSGKDEIAAMSRDYNAFADSLASEMDRLQEVSSRSWGLGDVLLSNARQINSGAGSIRKTLQELQASLNTLNEGVNSPDFSLGEVQKFLQTLLADLADQSSSVDGSRATTSEMVLALQLISNETAQKLEFSGQLTELGKRGDAQMQSTVQAIHNVAKVTEGVAEFIRVIHDVADQTNLLAMNASIEAAHAGAAGRGFAVVAGEIRKLSEATTANARNISASLEQIVTTVRKAEEDVSGTGRTIHELTSGVENLSIAMMTVNAALMALSDETNTVTNAFEHLRGLTDGVLSRSSALGTRLARIEGAMGDLVDVANQNTEGFEVIAGELDELGDESARLLKVMDENGENVRVLEEVTGAFRTKG